MRLLVNLLILVMLVAITGGTLWHYRQQDGRMVDLQAVQDALATMQGEMYYHEALVDGSSEQTHYPREISPLWFPDGPPRNLLAPGSQWLDVAPASDQHDQPPDPIIHQPGRQAGFWYNPNLGLFRARVLPQATMSATVKLYNLINGTTLPELEERQPQAQARTQTAQVDDFDSQSSALDDPVAAGPAPRHKLPSLRDQDR